MADSEDKDVELATQIENAIHQHLRDHEGEFVTGWMVAVKVVTKDGSKAIWTFKDPEQPTWDTLGMLDYLTVREREIAASSMYEIIGDSDEDDG